MNRIRYLRQSIFPARFGITTDYKLYVKTLKRLDPKTEPHPEHEIFGENYPVITVKDQKHYVLMYFNPSKHKSIKDLMDTIAHECTHAWQAVREHMGEDNPGAETEAYMIGWLVGEAMKITVPEIAKMKYEHAN